MVPKFSALLAMAVGALLSSCGPPDVIIENADVVTVEGRRVEVVPACRRVTKQEYCPRAHVLHRRVDGEMVVGMVDLTPLVCKHCKRGNQIIWARYSRSPKNVGLSERQLMEMLDSPSSKSVEGSDDLIKCGKHLCETWVVEKGIPWNILISNNGEKPKEMIFIRNQMKLIIGESIS